MTTITLDNLLNDNRLIRLFSTESRPCALQLWVLQVSSELSSENRIVYGRLLPYSHASNYWYFSDNDKQLSLRQAKAKITRLNLYISSIHCEEFLRQLSTGQSLESISASLNLRYPQNFIEQFGSTTLPQQNLVYRPVAYLLNRDAYDRRSISSPHGAAGAFSASITQLNKEMLFRINDEYISDLTAAVVTQLNYETGLDFAGVDVARFGDLELLVFPTLNELEQNLLSVNWNSSPSALFVRFNSTQVPCFDRFQFRLSIVNGGQIVSSTIAWAKRVEDGVFEYFFLVSEDLKQRTDSTEIEIFGFLNDKPDEGVQCCQWQIGYIREINLLGSVRGQETRPAKFDWLERAVKPAMSDRMKAALTINRGNLGFDSCIGGRKADPWVSANREVQSLFTRLHPPKSEGRFFPRMNQGEGDGRLQFVEWFKQLLASYSQHQQVVVFDPYFDDAGLGLMILCAEHNADYIIFRSMPKSIPTGKPLRRKSDTLAQDAINNLMANCERNRRLMRGIKFRIYGLKEGRLHDRYILIMGSDSLPIAGFHLSNSLQKAAENYPLLVTPIPADVLHQVEQYKRLLVNEAVGSGASGEAENSTIKLLFDSANTTSVPRNYEPLRFLEKSEAGRVLSVWTGEKSLRDLVGDQLKKQMVKLELIRDNSLNISHGLQNCISNQQINLETFPATWDVIGEVLAHSLSGDSDWQELVVDTVFMTSLTQFLNSSFERLYMVADQELAVVDVGLFSKSLNALLSGFYRVEHFFHATKYTALTWAEYFAIKVLWSHDPDLLLTIAEQQIANISQDVDDKEVVRLSLLSQIVSEVSLSLQFNISQPQRERLVHSSNGLLKFMGLMAIERQLDKPDEVSVVLLSLKEFAPQERMRIVGWMLHHVATDSNKEELYKSLIAVMHELSSPTLSLEELRNLVDSLRGHMGTLAWSEPWLFRDVILPLVENDRASADYVCDIWVSEIANMLGPSLKDQSRFFDRAREGQTTNIAAFLFANCNLKQRKASLKSISDILVRQKRALQQPLASTSNWTQWDDALTVSLWILAFSRWAEFYLSQLGEYDQQVILLSQEAYKLSMLRPLEEWQSYKVGKQGELILFLEQAENLLSGV